VHTRVIRVRGSCGSRCVHMFAGQAPATRNQTEPIRNLSEKTLFFSFFSVQPVPDSRSWLSTNADYPS